MSLFWGNDTERVIRREYHVKATVWRIFHCGRCGVNLNTSDSVAGTTYVRCTHCDALNDLYDCK